MPSNLGAILIWTSWSYVAIAVILARATFSRARRENPSYFVKTESAAIDPLKLEVTRGILEFISDDTLANKGFGISTLRMATIVKIMYFTSPIALILFLAGILLR